MEAVQAPLPAGAVVYEHYVVESLFGTGDFGNIYLVRDQRDEQKLFALAELFNVAQDKSYRFALSYVSRVPLDQRVLPRVQYAYNDNRLGRTYLLMNYIDEPNLEALRLQQAEQRFPLLQIVKIMTPVVNAVIHLHQQHPPIIHGNIQPACIIASQSMETPVLAMLDLFEEHGSVSTPLHYCAPGYGAREQYDGKWSVRTDVYGLGATYYTLLTGVVPPGAFYRSVQQKNGKIDPLQPAHEVIPAVPRAMAEVIQQAMSLDAGDRFSSVEEFNSKVASITEQLSAESLPDTQPVAPSPSDDAPPEPREPYSSHLEEPDRLRILAPEQAGEESAPAPVPEKRRASRVGRTGVLLSILAFLLILGVGADFWFHVQNLPSSHPTALPPTVRLSSPTPGQTTTPVASPYPALAGAYAGTIYDVSANVSTMISLTGIQQNRDSISGYLTLGPKIPGSGPFKGVIDVKKRIHFVVMDAAGNARLFFEGTMTSLTTLTGDYYNCSPASSLQGNQCTRAPGSYGLWNVSLT